MHKDYRERSFIIIKRAIPYEKLSEEKLSFYVSLQSVANLYFFKFLRTCF